MRELILLAIVAALAVTALFRPRIGLYGYVWFAVMRPDVLAWSSGSYPYSLVLAIATLAGSIRYFGNAASFLRNPIVRQLLVLQIPLALSVLFAVNSSIAIDPFLFYLRMVVMSLLIPLLIETGDQLATLLLVIAVSMGVLASKFGLFGLVSGGVRFSGGYGGLLSDNNSMALAFVMGMALCWHLRPTLKSRWLRMAMLGMVVLAMAGAIMTYSRGAALSLAAVLLFTAFTSRHRLATLVLMASLCFPAFYLVRESYVDRLSTMKSGEAGGNRLDNYRAAIAMWLDHPIFGVGYGKENQQRLLSRYTDRDEETEIVIHDTYLQMLVDSGIFALVVYLLLLFGTIFRMGRLARRTRESHPATASRARAIQTALIAFAVGGTFLSRIDFDLTYMLCLCAATLLEVDPGESVDDIAAERETSLSCVSA